MNQEPPEYEAGVLINHSTTTFGPWQCDRSLKVSSQVQEVLTSTIRVNAPPLHLNTVVVVRLLLHEASSGQVACSILLTTCKRSFRDAAGLLGGVLWTCM